MATASWWETLFTSRADYTAVASTASEASLIAGNNVQPTFWAGYFDAYNRPGRTIRILASGIFSTTGTPTMIFQARLGTTSGSSFLSGTSVGVSAAITTGSGVTNKYFELDLTLTARTLGIGTGNTTLSGFGKVVSPGFASPFIYPLEPTTPDTATWTSTIDMSLVQYLNLSLTWSASSASNTCTLKDLIVLGLN